MKSVKIFAAAISASMMVASMMAGGAAHAARVDTATIVNGDGSGNDCSGDLGTSPTCVLVIDNGDGTEFRTPQIMKIDFYYRGDSDHSGGPTEVEIDREVNTNTFPSLNGSEFSFDSTDSMFKQFTYSLGADDPLLTHFSVKKGNGYTVYNGDFVADDGYFTFDSTTKVFTGIFAEDEPSHIVLFDSATLTPPVTGVIPLPAAGWLLVTVFGGLAALARLRQAA